MKFIKSLLRQRGLPTWVGGIQTQIQTSAFYIFLYNVVMITMTFWVTAGPRVKEYFPWMNAFLFVAILLFGFLFIVVPFDYIFILPARIAFSSRQSYRHKNPAVADLQAILKISKKQSADIQLIKNKLGVVNEND